MKLPSNSCDLIVQINPDLGTRLWFEITFKNCVLSPQPCTQNFCKIRHCYLMIWWWLLVFYVQMALQSENFLDICPFWDIPLAVQNCILFSRWRILVVLLSHWRRRRRFHRDTEVRCVGAHPPFWPLEPWGLNPIKPVYDPDRPDGQLSWLNYLIGDLG